MKKEMLTNKRLVLLLVLLALSLLLLSGCAPGANPLVNTPNDQGYVANFWTGLWQGFIVPVTFIISLFNQQVNIYEVQNDGISYNIGFAIGALIITGGLAGGGARGGRRYS
jgi:hypothetical protein